MLTVRTKISHTGTHINKGLWMSQSSRSHRPLLIFWASGVDAGAQRSPHQNTHSPSLSRNKEDKRELWARGPWPYLLWHEEVFPRACRAPKDEWAHQDPVRSGRSFGNPECYRRGADMGFATCFEETSFLRHRQRQMSLEKWAAQLKTHGPAAFSLCFSFHFFHSLAAVWAISES